MLRILITKGTGPNKLDSDIQGLGEMATHDLETIDDEVEAMMISDLSDQDEDVLNYSMNEFVDFFARINVA